MGICDDFGSKNPVLRFFTKSAGMELGRPKSGKSKVRPREGTKGPNRATSLSEATCWTNGSCAVRNLTCLGGWGGIAGLKRSDSAQRLENGAKSGKMGSGFFPVLGHGRVVIWVSE